MIIDKNLFSIKLCMLYIVAKCNKQSRSKYNSFGNAIITSDA